MIYIWIRATTDWEDESVFSAQMPAGFESKVMLWNQAFNIPYHSFRHEVRQIAQLNHSRIEGARFAAWKDIPDGALVVPVDDDDWFAPSLCRILEGAYDRGFSGYYWPSRFIEVPIDWRHDIGKALRSVVPFIRPKWFCATNNYALVKTRSVERLFRSHVQASAWFKANRATQVRKIKQCLSVMNRTLASQTSLAYKRAPFARTKIALSSHRYRRVYLEPLPDELEWAKPYQALMSELMSKLRFRDPPSAGFLARWLAR